MIFNLIYRSLRQHLLATLVTAGSIALASGLLLTVWVVKTQSQAVFAATNSGFDAVLGARGSKLQLVLNAIFHLEASPGNLTAADFEMIRHQREVKTAPKRYLRTWNIGRAIVIRSVAASGFFKSANLKPWSEVMRPKN